MFLKLFLSYSCYDFFKTFSFRNVARRSSNRDITHLASNLFLREQILSLVVEDDVHFLGAVSAYVWAEHDLVRRVTVHVLLIEITSEHLHA